MRVPVVRSVRLAATLRHRLSRARTWNAHDTVGVLDALLLLLLAIRRGVRPWAGRVVGIARRAALPIGLLLLVLSYLHSNAVLPFRPHDLSAHGWWIWYDQSKTLEALQGWRTWHPTLANQWYQPLYPLLGALGMAVTPSQPFLLVDLAGLIASFLIFVPLARQLAIGRLASAVLFLLVVAAEPSVIANWVIPWNTSLSAPLILLGLWSAAGLASRPSADRRSLVRAAVFGASAGLLPSLRPTDVITLVPAALVVGLSVMLARPAWSKTRVGMLFRIGAAGLAGFIPALAVTVATFVPVFGFHPSPYMTMSKQTGFDLHLLFQHWVELVVGPRPLFPGASGLMEGFPWLAGALAGIAAFLFAPDRSRWRAHAVVLSAIVPFWVLYLSYRDLNVPGLWGFHNFHYFIWSFPLLACYGWLLLCRCGRILAGKNGRSGRLGASLPVLGSVLVLVLALCWRPELRSRIDPGPPPRLDAAASTVSLPSGLSRMNDALLVSSLDHAGKIYFGDHTLEEGGRTFHDFSDFRAFPVPGGMMVMPLRVLPAGPGVLHVDPGVTLDPTIPPVMLRQAMVFGLPCWVPRIVRAAICRQVSPLPGPLFPIGKQIDFNGKMEPGYLIPGGWTDQSDGRWTLGYFSSLQFRVPNRASIGKGVTVEVEGAGFIPRGAEWLQIDVSANGHTLTRWVVSTVREVALRVSVPAELIPANGEVELTLSVLNARRPAEVMAGSTDRRLLGFRVRAIRLLPWSEETDSSP